MYKTGIVFAQLSFTRYLALKKESRKKECLMPKVQKIVDLSQEINKDTQVYPGDPVPSFIPAATIEKDGFNILHVCMGSQSGTHADAPYHFSYEGKTIEQCDLSLFVGEGIIIPAYTKKAHEPITRAEVESYVSEMGPGKIVLLHTGWSKYNRLPQYFEHPFLSLLPLKMTGADGGPMRAVAMKFE
jgi:kynurenine formamidase